MTGETGRGQVKVVLRHIFVEALQLVSLLSQRRVQVQIVSIRRQLQGALLQLRDRQGEERQGDRQAGGRQNIS